MKTHQVSWFLLFLSVFQFGCDYSVEKKEYLTKVSENLSRIKSASYFSTTVASAPGDTAKFSEPQKHYYKIFVHPDDTLVGSGSVTFSAVDTAKATDFYDGAVRGTINWEKEYVKVDSFQNYPYPFRLVYYPFYTRINEIIKYTITTKDSIQTDFKDYGDSVFFSLRIVNKHVYFHIKPIVIKNEYIPDDEISQFDIWFNKNDNLPYRMRSKWHHTTLFESCTDAKFNFTNDVDFKASEYYPAHFEIIQFVRGEGKPKTDMVGKKAPDWILKDTRFNEVKLADLKSRVLLIQFTGVGCGPCHQAVPFLKQLVENYKTKDFEFVSIETWSNNMEGLKRYEEKNGFNYKFLKSTDEVTKAYEVSSVPVFFVIDQKRVIRNVINGYSKTSTDKEIIESIEKLL